MNIRKAPTTRRLQNHPQQKGFTLVELMVAVIIIGILATVGLPSFIGLLERNRTVAISNEILGAIQFARSEAVRVNGSAQVCPSANGTACTGDEDWSNGWIVLRGGTVLRVGQGHPAVTATGPTSIEFGSAGNITSTLGAITVTSGDTSRCVTMVLSGTAEAGGCG